MSGSPEAGSNTAPPLRLAEPQRSAEPRGDRATAPPLPPPHPTPSEDRPQAGAGPPRHSARSRHADGLHMRRRDDLDPSPSDRRPAAPPPMQPLIRAGPAFPAQPPATAGLPFPAHLPAIPEGWTYSAMQELIRHVQVGSRTKPHPTSSFFRTCCVSIGKPSQIQYLPVSAHHPNQAVQPSLKPLFIAGGTEWAWWGSPQ